MTFGQRLSSLLLAFLVVGVSLRADRGNQQAADEYDAARRLVREGRYSEAIPRLLKAIRLAPEPNEWQGGERRFRVDRWDPYYWLGVAQMELGRTNEALISFEKSLSTTPVGASRPVVLGWKAEYTDLVSRKSRLEERLASTFPQPTHTAPISVASAATAVPTPVVSTAPTPTPIRVVLSTATAIRLVVPTFDPAVERDRQALAALRDRLAALSRATWATSTRPTLSASMIRLDAALRHGRPPVLSSALAEETRSFRRLLPELRRQAIGAAVSAMSEHRWAEAEAALTAMTVAEPGPEIELLGSVLAGTRFVMQGRRDTAVLSEARRLFRSWRGMVPPKTPVPPIVSPSLLRLLEGGGPRS